MKTNAGLKVHSQAAGAVFKRDFKTMKVLFLGHSATRTGAPMLLLALIRWLKKTEETQAEVLLLEQGALANEYARAAPTRIFQPREEQLGLLSRVKRKLAGKKIQQSYRKKLLADLRKAEFDLIYCNTITLGHVLLLLEPLACPVLTHVHELQYWITRAGDENLALVKQLSSHFIAASEAVNKNLVDNNGIQPEHITTIHEFLIPPSREPSDFARHTIRESLHICDSSIVVVGGGAEHWRKGKDLFVQLAFLVRSRGHHNTHFLWLGEWDHPDRKLEIAHDLELLALSDQVHFIGQVDDPTDYFAAADFFVMVSREDPFPLVCLEAAFVSKPIICFSHAGGMPEFVADDCGFVVPYLDLNSMADKIELLIENPALAEKLGSNARTKVLQNHSLERIAPEILDCMRQTARTRADRIE